MFLTDNYILSSEFIDRTGIHVAYISKVIKLLEDDNDSTTIIKMNACNFIKSNSGKLPNNIQKAIIKETAIKPFYNFSNKLPVHWLKQEYNVTEKEWFKSGIVEDKVTIHGKIFYVFSDDFIRRTKNCICYVLDKEETQKCTQNGQIENSIQLSNNKFMTWYKLRK